MTSKKKGGDTRAKAAAHGKRVGRPPKAKIVASADKSVASAVLGTLDEIAVWRFLLHADALADPEKRKLLTAGERHEIGDHMEYLTNRRDGKPAESIIAEGKLEIIVREEGAGDYSTTETGSAEKVM
jgi:hypothetical protein